MALEEFEKEEMDPRDKRYVTMRSTMDYGMGVVWTGMGVFIVFADKFTNKFPQFNEVAFKVFGGVAIVYGLFRIYRGFKKKYFR